MDAMLLIIHGGLHKTATTYLQAVLNRNGRKLRDAGVYFEPDGRMLGNHSTATHALQGNFVGIQEHAALARSRGLDTMILSSENFETLIFEHHAARSVEGAAREAGIRDIEWHFCLRDPGEYFASQFAQLSQHGFVEFVSMFLTVLRDGALRVPNDAAHDPPYWHHCFDYQTHLAAFAGAVSGKIVFHDFRDSRPFPGHGILDRAVGESLTYDLPVKDGPVNQRLPDGRVETNFASRLREVADLALLSPETRTFMESRIHVPREVREDCAKAVSERFSKGMERLLLRETQVASPAT